MATPLCPECKVGPLSATDRYRNLLKRTQKSQIEDGIEILKWEIFDRYWDKFTEYEHFTRRKHRSDAAKYAPIWKAEAKERILGSENSQSSLWRAVHQYAKKVVLDSYLQAMYRLLYEMVSNAQPAFAYNIPEKIERDFLFPNAEALVQEMMKGSDWKDWP